MADITFVPYCTVSGAHKLTGVSYTDGALYVCDNDQDAGTVRVLRLDAGGGIAATITLASPVLSEGLNVSGTIGSESIDVIADSPIPGWGLEMGEYTAAGIRAAGIHQDGYGSVYYGTEGLPYVWIACASYNDRFTAYFGATFDHDYDESGAVFQGICWHLGRLWLSELSGGQQRIRTYNYSYGVPETAGPVYTVAGVPSQIDDIASDGTNLYAVRGTTSVYWTGLTVGRKVAMSQDPSGVPWYAWIDASTIKVNCLDALPATPATAIVVATTTAYDSLSECSFDGHVIRIVARQTANKKPYLFYSGDLGATWNGPMDVS